LENKQVAEDAKVGIRNARKDANTEIKKLEKMEPLKTFVKCRRRSQTLTNSYIRKVDELLVHKDAEIMKV
jgi:ribosome recycling factor